MDLWIIAALVGLVAWAVATFAFTAPGWLHLVLTASIFVIIWRTVARATPTPRDLDAEPPAGGTDARRR